MPHDGPLNIVGLGQSRSRGVRKGEISDPSVAEVDIRHAITEAEQMADVEIRSVYLGVTGGHLRGFNNRGVRLGLVLLLFLLVALLVLVRRLLVVLLGRVRLRRLLRECREMGLRGLKLHVTPTPEVLDTVAELGIPILWHPRPDVATFSKVAAAYPTVDFILAHLGSDLSDDWREHLAGIESARQHPNVYLDTGAVVLTRYIEQAVKELGPEKIILGGPVSIAGDYLLPSIRKSAEILRRGLGGPRVGTPLDRKADLGARLQRLIGDSDRHDVARALGQVSEKLLPETVEVPRIAGLCKSPSPEIMHADHRRQARAAGPTARRVRARRRPDVTRACAA